MFSGHNWDQYSIDDFIQELDSYIHWYRSGRIKLTLGGLSPLEYRRSIGIAV
ncbi:IS3 family transposase [Blautia producta]|uniref:IS3 family transposase n=1 Tax=Blautia producta TaxID=33035 RepID=UPI003A7F389C